MDSPPELNYLGNIGEFGRSSKQSLSFQTIHCREREYELFISILHTCRIIACRFSLHSNLIDSEEIITDETRNTEDDTILIRYWKSFCLPFCLEEFLLSKDGVWVLGEECYSNIRSYLLPHLESPTDDSLMEVDDDEFHLRDFEQQLDLPTTLKHKLPTEKFCLKCDLLQKGVVLGSRDSGKLRLSAASSYYEPVLDAELSEIKPLLEISLDRMKRQDSIQDDPQPKPVFQVFPVQLGGCKSNVLRTLLCGSQRRNCVGFVGTPDGKISYFLCTRPVEANTLARDALELRELYDLEQPVLGVHVGQNIGGIRGTSVIAVGSLGRIVCFSEMSLTRNSKEIQIAGKSPETGRATPLHANVFELFSSLRQHALCEDHIFFLTPEGKLCRSRFSAREVRGSRVLELSKSCCLMEGVDKFLLLEDSDGLFLVLTNSGSLNLYEFNAEKEKEETIPSLPALMHQAMTISSSLQELNTTKALQTRFFEAVSTFASFKFKDAKDMKIHFSYSITAVESPPRKFVSIAIKGLAHLKMEPEFWVLSATAFSRFEKSCPIVSKTVPLDPETPSICLELDESIFRSWHSTSIPLVVEVGFILTLPDDLKRLVCFKIIERELPLYAKVQELILDEISFMEVMDNRGAATHRQNAPGCHDDRLARNVIEYAMRRPVYHLLRPESSPHRCQDFPDTFKFGILQSTAEALISSDTPDVGLHTEWLHTLMRKAMQDRSTAIHVKCRGKTASISLSTVNSHMLFSIHSEAFDLLVGIRMAIAKRLVMLQDLTSKADANAFRVSPQLKKDCEKLSSELQSLYGRNVDSEDFDQEIRNKYKALRNITSKLVYC